MAAPKRKPLPSGVTEAQRAADIQAGRSERAGHEMIRKSPPPKRSVSDIVFGVGRSMGQALRGAVFPKAETERQKKLKEARENKPIARRTPTRKRTRKATRTSGRG